MIVLLDMIIAEPRIHRLCARKMDNAEQMAPQIDVGGAHKIDLLQRTVWEPCDAVFNNYAMLEFPFEELAPYLRRTRTAFK